MSRAAIETMLAALEAAYRGDGYHALLENLRDVRDDEWSARPANHSVEVFGTNPELSIADIIKHVAASKLMWGNHAFGDATLDWFKIAPPSAERTAMLAWLDDAHEGFVSGVAALTDDSQLATEHRSHSGRLLTVREVISTITNHDLYHAGEINRQRALIRGASGWERDA